MSEPKQEKILEALAKINLAIEPIKKDQKNAFQGYNFRGIDQVYNLLQSIYSKNKVMPIPRVLQRLTSNFPAKDGKIQFKVEQEMIFKLLSLEDGSFVEIGPIWGEAMDTSDKATNKSNSAAAKYAFLMSHLIPTEDLDDGDNDHPEVQPDEQKKHKGQFSPSHGGPAVVLKVPGDFVIDFGTKFKGKKLSELSLTDIQKNIEYWKAQGTLSGNPKDFVANAEAYLKEQK